MPTWLKERLDSYGRAVFFPILTGSNPMKKDQPGVHPENEGSKWLSAKSAERRPAAALTDRQMRITSSRRETE